MDKDVARIQESISTYNPCILAVSYSILATDADPLDESPRASLANGAPCPAREREPNESPKERRSRQHTFVLARARAREKANVREHPKEDSPRFHI